MMHLYEGEHEIERQSSCLGLSVGLHILILILMCFNFSWNTDEFEKSPPAILMVDLTKVKIDEKTNLPPLVKEVKKEEPKPQEVKQEKKTEPKKEDKTPLVKKEAVAPKAEPQKPVETPKKEAVKVQEKKVEPKKEVKKEPKKEVKKEKPKPQEKPKPKVAPKPIPKKQSQGLQSLLASVEKVRKPANTAPASPSKPSGETVNKGIKGGTEGSFMNELTISEKDLIANKIRSCWNVNAGVQDADKMIIEVRAFINKDGSVREVKILNMKQDPIFRSMAESAKRAIYVCDAKGEESPFRILANKRPEMYNSWKQIYLRMNPVDGGVY